MASIWHKGPRAQETFRFFGNQNCRDRMPLNIMLELDTTDFQQFVNSGMYCSAIRPNRPRALPTKGGSGRPNKHEYWKKRSCGTLNTAPSNCRTLTPSPVMRVSQVSHITDRGKKEFTKLSLAHTRSLQSMTPM